MKRVLTLAVSLLALLLMGCQQKETPKTATKPKELADPEITISGVPSAAIESGESFTVTVTSKSAGALTLSSDKPTVATIKANDGGTYSVTAVSQADVTVKLTASQEADGDYSAGSAEASFQVKGAGVVELPGPEDSIEGTAVEYVEATGEVAGPERGMYSAYEVHTSTDAISATSVSSRRTSEGLTLWLLEFYLTDFMNGGISSSYLQKIDDCFNAVRTGGAKAIVRFAYRDNNDHLEEDQEPELDQILKHISQVKSILTKYEDVIFVLQAGFIGSWGEWYYTTHFGNSYSNRRKVVDALLDALPASRQIELRTPAFKMKMYDIALKDTLTAAKAHDGSAASRLGGHNDCFVASANDQGTFSSDQERKYWKAETRYTIMGGETCDPLLKDYPGNDVYSDCDKTLKHLKDYHWTYLHNGYYRPILTKWQNQGCFSDIKAQLGYRLVLKDVHYEAIKAGQKCKVTLRFYNKGYAAPMNPREAWLVWETPDGKTEKTLLGSDPRTWHSGYNAVVATFTPSTAKGTLYLELSDPLLKDNPVYSLPLANKDVFNATTGYNKLFEVK